jgi:hypothetical protein
MRLPEERPDDYRPSYGVDMASENFSADDL